MGLYSTEQSITITPTDGESFAILQNDDVIAVRPRLHLLDEIEVENRRPVYSREFGGIQLPFHPMHRVAYEIGLSFRV